VTAVDQCAPSTVAGSEHFDIGPEAYKELFGGEGTEKGSMIA